jgi:hypothetical protein
MTGRISRKFLIRIQSARANNTPKKKLLERDLVLLAIWDLMRIETILKTLVQAKKPLKNKSTREALIHCYRIAVVIQGNVWKMDPQLENQIWEEEEILADNPNSRIWILMSLTSIRKLWMKSSASIKAPFNLMKTS